MSSITQRFTSTLQFRHVIFLAIAFRIALIIYADYHDKHSILKYTDVDYRVFSDASRSLLNANGDDAVAKGILGRVLPLGDPYTRATYRYTPLLAVMLLPNLWIHPAFGKLLFSIADVGIGLILRHITRRSSINVSSHTGGQPTSGLTQPEVAISLLWLLNPFTVNISTRGSAESLLGLMVIVVLAFALHRRWMACAAMLAFSAHWKIYPIIYISSILPFIGVEDDPKVDLCSDIHGLLQYWLRWCLNKKRLAFIAVFLGSFFLLLSLTYLFWGFPVLEHTYLYHVGRTDHRHNFSVYFYPLYLGLTSSIWSTNPQSRVLGLAAFFPQMVLSIYGGFLLARSLVLQDRSATTDTKKTSTLTARSSMTEDQMKHLPFIFFVQTFIFVTLNKVCTSQYFMWYLWFLPLVIPHLSTSTKGGGVSMYKALLMIAVWVGAQALWLSQGYLLEFLGNNVFPQLWASGLIMLAANSWIVASLISSYRWDE
ncbi:GPI mannosyltransferase 1 [Serendipita sp. 396]|nr:GPI mannosyltransferase 1 [Serendipita sp. 396]KAG8826560.1 GPI mannosyltransferase 1 [Serendipita sp. 401]KAG9057207.1 GPI mannosyltransferase 1 [Serendipita sp. 407]